MNVLDVITSPWAITPDKLIEIRKIYLAHTRGEKPDLAAIEDRLGRPLANEPRGYQVIDGVAVLPLEGVIAPKMNLFMKVSGGTSSQLFASDLKAAAADPTVNSIVLAIDSPGGTVAGTENLAALVRDVAQRKLVVAHADSMMASAAYWIGAAADSIVISGNTTEVGSIGVVATHVDVSQAEAQQGYKTTEITAGKYKRIASQYAPLSEEGRQTIQDQIDHLYGVFVDAVAQYRGTTADQVLADMADGRVFLGKSAKSAGLVDAIMSLDQLVTRMASGRMSPRRTTPSGASHALPSPTSPTGDTMDITKEKIAAEHPAIAEAFRSEGAVAAAAAERQRIQDVEAQLLPGHEQLIATLKFDGKTTGAEAAVQILAAERADRAKHLAAMGADAPKPLPATSTATGQRSDPADDPNLSVEDRCKAKWDSDAATRAEFTDLAAYTAFEKAQASGKVRVLGGKR